MTNFGDRTLRKSEVNIRVLGIGDTEGWKQHKDGKDVLVLFQVIPGSNVYIQNACQMMVFIM